MPALNAAAITRRLSAAGIRRVKSFHYRDVVFVHSLTTSTTVPPVTVERLDRAERVLRDAGFTVKRISPQTLSISLPKETS